MEMLVQLLLTIALLTAIFFVTRRLFALLYRCVSRITGNKHVAIWMVALVLLPGTIVHELSHFLVATLLRVPTDQISIFPDETLMGHVQIARSGPLRHTLIGVAPLISGLAVIYAFGLFLSQSQPILLFVICYMLFVISSTMFTSRSDLRSFIFVAPVVILLTIALYLSGIRVSVTENLQETMVNVTKRLNLSLALSGTLDAAILIFLRALIWSTRRLTHLVKE